VCEDVTPSLLTLDLGDIAIYERLGYF